MINKKITLTIQGYDIKLSSSLCFYQRDSIHLIFELNESTITINSNGTRSRVVLPIEPLSAFLLIEKAGNIDYIENASVVGNEVHFHISSKYTDTVGIGRMQIILTDDNCCQLTFSPFNFEVRENIAESLLSQADTLITDIDNVALMTNDGDGLTVGKSLVSDGVPVTSKYIRDLQQKGILDGEERLIIQDDEATKYTTMLNLYNYIIEHFGDTIDNEIREQIGTSGDELLRLKAQLNSLITNATNDLVAIRKLKKDYEDALAELNNQNN